MTDPSAPLADPGAPAAEADTRAASSVRPAVTVPRERARDAGVAVPTASSPTARRTSRGRLASWSLSVAMFALTASWFTGWALPLAVVGVVLAGVALLARRAGRELAWWGLGLGLGAVGCSAFWIVWGLRAAAEVAAVG
ncbi:hypothetical protein [Microbacterium marinilacus]|uniref:DUF4190 domain-containing protein n=1 Tax=Microbacterium marinilacus TaxID=415209 RepID=A0ABP7BCA3_9MICO|nr:hypothetical protein [Microbacterium marinilacus]MBY0689394.1 hypothetical protein [Microbacterium marinilacus]